MLKKLLSRIFLSVLTLSGTNLYAQQRNGSGYDIEFSITPLAESTIGPRMGLMGSGSDDSKNYIAGLLRVGYRYNETWTFGAGVGYSHQNITTTSAIVDPSAERMQYSSELSIWEIPLDARVKFLKYLYANAGPILHFQQNTNSYVDKQNGIGIHIGLGAKIPLSQQFAVTLSPHYKMYSLIPFQSERNYDRVRIFGIGIGVNYRIAK
ncbi:outer membrane beta-barrel protein [Sphingobacterium multivorum]|uniref:Outer membrane beta-barrel protein n=1 Tax=Sphingobacterium multivorum TaxID=28454 RepID=A0ABX7CL64_SPHMU|nr:outer membrane beta-barrel protein [Sphingobacterium multivorum]QQT32003.1 outer membrane beta-barrel protein [Sphingobacterium multivorum]QQT52075.1 outer membrane beta-barrel protein [Sphingobacterium multivorum]